jgi:hypothetical protein
MPASGGGARDTIPAGQVMRAGAAIAALRAESPSDRPLWSIVAWFLLDFLSLSPSLEPR